MVASCTEIIGTLVALLMGVPGLDWSRPCTHVETFAGCQAVTMGEIQERVSRGVKRIEALKV